MPLTVVALFRRPVGHVFSPAYSLRDSRHSKRGGAKGIAAALAVMACSVGVAGSDEGKLGSPNTASPSPVTSATTSNPADARDGTTEACERAWHAFFICLWTSPNPTECVQPDCSATDEGPVQALRLMAEARMAAFRAEAAPME